MDEVIARLSRLAQGKVSVTYNEHVSLDMNVQRYLTHKGIQLVGGAGMPLAKVQAMVNANCVVFVQVEFKNTLLLGAYGHTVEVALTALIELIEGMALSAANKS